MKIFSRGVIKFTPRDIGMWRKDGEQSATWTRRFKSFHDFMRWVDTKTTVVLDDPNHPFKLEYEPLKNRFIVIQWTVIGWIETE